MACIAWLTLSPYWLMYIRPYCITYILSHLDCIITIIKKEQTIESNNNNCILIIWIEKDNISVCFILDWCQSNICLTDIIFLFAWQTSYSFLPDYIMAPSALYTLYSLLPDKHCVPFRLADIISLFVCRTYSLFTWQSVLFHLTVIL